MIISGDVTSEEVMRLAASIYGPIPRGDVPARRNFAGSPPPEPAQQRFTMSDAGVEQAQVEMDAVVPSYSTQKDQ